MAAIDVLLPAKREDLGIILHEAQAMEMPLSTTAVRETADAVRVDVGGVLAEAEPILDWGRDAAVLIEHNGRKQELGKSEEPSYRSFTIVSKSSGIFSSTCSSLRYPRAVRLLVNIFN